MIFWVRCAFLKVSRLVTKRQHHFSSMLWFTLTANLYATDSSSVALKLQTPETAYSEGTETEGNSGRQDFCSSKLQKHVVWNSYTIFTCWENTTMCLLEYSYHGSLYPPIRRFSCNSCVWIREGVIHDTRQLDGYVAKKHVIPWKSPHLSVRSHRHI